jgi:lipocalin-like protein
MTFTLGRHMVVWLVGGDRKRPSDTVPTDAERLAWFKDIISACGGSYSVEGNKYVMHIESAWIPAWYGTDQTRYFSFDGSKLVLKTAPFKSAFDGMEVINTLVLEKVE